MELTVFVCRDMNLIGGLQSLVLRLASDITDRGEDWFIICEEDSLLQQVSKSKILSASSNPTELAKNCLKKEKRPVTTVNILALSPFDAAKAFAFAISLNKYRRSLITNFRLGVYHPRDFRRESESVHVHVMNFVLGQALGPERIFFMNEQCRESHVRILGRRFSRSEIHHLPIKRNSIKWCKSKNPFELRIVSIGRIVPFKAYNFHIPELAHILNKKAFSVYFDIYGHGTHQKELTNNISDFRVNKSVRFAGTLESDRFDETVLGYDLFIGMGTAALQAAQLGVPTLLAIDNDKVNTYGFISNVPFGNVGENDTALSRYSLLAEIQRFSKLSSAERIAISVAGSWAANRYVASDYLDTILKGSRLNYTINNRFISFLCLVYIFVIRFRIRSWLWRAIKNRGLGR